MSSELYQRLIDEAEQLTSQLNERYRSHLKCGAGCSSCCHHHLSIFQVEAENIKPAIEALAPEIRERVNRQAHDIEELEAKNEPVACPLLIDDHCSVYEARPLICRTQGLPLLYEAEDGTSEVDFCPLNFTSDEAIAELDENYLVPLDALNLKLAMANIEYCRNQQVAPEKTNVRIKIGAIIRSLP